jgi:ferredoxin-NADP reductase
VDGPHGDFVLAGREAASVALFAGGIGIAPILGILRDMQLSGDRRPVSLVYGARNQERLVGRDAISEAASALSLRVDYVLEMPPPHWQGSVGGITAEVVRQAIIGRDPRHCICLLCGPTGMMLAIERVLLEAGVPARNIVYEQFDYD